MVARGYRWEFWSFMQGNEKIFFKATVILDPLLAAVHDLNR